jgi:hypothetical protein
VFAGEDDQPFFKSFLVGFGPLTTPVCTYKLCKGHKKGRGATENLEGRFGRCPSLARPVGGRLSVGRKGKKRFTWNLSKKHMGRWMDGWMDILSGFPSQLLPLFNTHTEP